MMSPSLPRHGQGVLSENIEAEVLQMQVGSTMA